MNRLRGPIVAALLVTVFLGAALLSAGWTELTEPPLREHPDRNTIAGMRGLLPRPGEGEVVSVTPTSSYVAAIDTEIPGDWTSVGVPLPNQACLPDTSVAKRARARSGTLAATVTFRDGAEADVRLVRLARSSITVVSATLRDSAARCAYTAPFGGDENPRNGNLLVREGRPRGDESATYREFLRVPTPTGWVSVGEGGPTTHALSGEWLVEVASSTTDLARFHRLADVVLASLDVRANTRFLPG